MSDPTYDRELIARMLDEHANEERPSHTAGAIREQIAALRAADNADAAGVRTVNTTGPVRAQFEAWASSPDLDMDISRHPEDDVTWAGQYIDAGLQRAWEAWQAALASAPPSAPVGVQAVVKAMRLLAGVGIPVKPECVGRWADQLEALAQQPEAPAQVMAEVVQEDDGVSLRFVGPILPKGTKLYTAPQPAIPEGWVLVPMEPTAEMKVAGAHGIQRNAHRAELTYLAMLAARPTQESDHG